MYEVFEHTADLGLRITAATLQELFVEAARGLFSLVVANPDMVRQIDEQVVTVSAEKLDLLLFDWLNELLYLLESKRLLFVDFAVELNETNLRAICRGEPLDESRHRLEHEVKAITYHALRVVQTADGWLAEVIVDI